MYNTGSRGAELTGLENGLTVPVPNDWRHSFSRPHDPGGQAPMAALIAAIVRSMSRAVVR